jgi:hypothetical protein
MNQTWPSLRYLHTHVADDQVNQSTNMTTTFNRKYSYNTSNIRIKIDKEAMFSEAWIVSLLPTPLD